MYGLNFGIGMKIKYVEIVNSLERRIQHIQNSEKKLIPKVLAIEWIEPFFTAVLWKFQIFH